MDQTFIKEGYESEMPYLPDEADIDYRLLLIGDAGEPAADVREPVLEAVEIRAKRLPSKTSVIFLGDNIYPDGLVDGVSSLRIISESRLKEQVKVIENSKASGFFVPGNHDWDRGGPKGWSKIIEQEKFVYSIGDTNVNFYPKGGCPGPVVLDRGSKLRIIVLDTQWWLHPYDKPAPGNSDCIYATEDDIIEALDNAISSAGGRFVVIAAHHPLDTHGPHGGFFEWTDHLFPLLELNPYLYIPLPVIGSLYPLSRMWGISSQDISSSAYQNMIDRIQGVISKYNNVAFAAGHEHSLQLLNGVNGIYYLISGFGTSIHNSSVEVADNTIYADDKQGFMQVDVLKDGKSRLAIFQVDEESKTYREIFSLWLNRSADESANKKQIKIF